MTTGPIRFSTHLLRTGKTTTGIDISAEIIAQLAGGARPAVAVKVNDYRYRTTVGAMGGMSLLPFSAEHRRDSGIKGGDAIDVELVLDTAPRLVEIPADLEFALGAESALRAAFLKQARSRQKADVDNIIGAKTTETRERRVAAVLAKLRQ